MNASKPFSIQVAGRTWEFTLPHTVDREARSFSPEGLDVARAVRDAMENPIAFPNVASAILEEDTVAIAIDPDVPEAIAIASTMVAWMLEQPQAPHEIILVLGSAPEPQREAWSQAFAGWEGDEPDRPRVRVVWHDPHTQERLEYVAAAESADPIYIQRDLVEAAFVLPVYCVRHDDAPNACDLYAMSPMFADAQTQRRWNEAWFEDNRQHKHRQLRLSREAGWLMGIQYAIAVLPAPDGRVGQLWGGDPETVHRQAEDAWRAHYPARSDEDPNYDLIVATLEGPASQKHWLNAARSAWAADRQLSPAGRIVLCVDLDRVTEGIASLASDEPDDILQQQLLNSASEDAFAASILRSIQARRSIYLLSGIDSGTAESLGFAVISEGADLERLVASSQRVAWWDGAQY
jgi:hypothetical protein